MKKRWVIVKSTFWLGDGWAGSPDELGVESASVPDCAFGPYDSEEQAEQAKRQLKEDNLTDYSVVELKPKADL